MPIAFFLVAMITLMSGWYQMESHAQEMEMIRKSEAQAVAASIAAHHLKVIKCARYKDQDTNTLPNWNSFLAYRGTGQQFLTSYCAGMPGPDWVNNAPMPGVNLQINDGSVTITYTPTAGLHATRAGVQGELNRMTHNSITLGEPVWGY